MYIKFQNFLKNIDSNWDSPRGGYAYKNLSKKLQQQIPVPD